MIDGSEVDKEARLEKLERKSVFVGLNYFRSAPSLAYITQGQDYIYSQNV